MISETQKAAERLRIAVEAKDAANAEIADAEAKIKQVEEEIKQAHVRLAAAHRERNQAGCRFNAAQAAIWDERQEIVRLIGYGTNRNLEPVTQTYSPDGTDHF